MARPKPWDGVMFVVIQPIKGGGWYRSSTHLSKDEAEAFRMTPLDRILRVKVRLPKD